MVKILLLNAVFLSLFNFTSNATNIARLFHNNSNNNFKIILNMAKKGNIEAMYYTALSYEIGNGTNLNYRKAFVWYKKAANLGYPLAQYNLAFMYKYGYGTKKNLILSYKWFYISGHDYECHLDAQQMSLNQIKKAKKLAETWTKKHKY